MDNYLSRKGGRRFSYNGRRYYVTDLCKQYKQNGMKYFLSEIMPSGAYKILYNHFGWDIPKFKTIHDARAYVRDYDFMLETM